MAGLVPAIHDFARRNILKTWMPATSAGMTAYTMHMETANQGTGTNGALPLAGVRVLEFCHAIMGPSAGLILADLGADVIKVEPVDWRYDPAPSRLCRRLLRHIQSQQAQPRR